MEVSNRHRVVGRKTSQPGMLDLRDRRIVASNNIAQTCGMTYDSTATNSITSPPPGSEAERHHQADLRSPSPEAYLRLGALDAVVDSQRQRSAVPARLRSHSGASTSGSKPFTSSALRSRGPAHSLSCVSVRDACSSASASSSSSSSSSDLRSGDQQWIMPLATKDCRHMTNAELEKELENSRQRLEFLRGLASIQEVFAEDADEDAGFGAANQYRTRRLRRRLSISEGELDIIGDMSRVRPGSMACQYRKEKSSANRSTTGRKTPSCPAEDTTDGEVESPGILRRALTMDSATRRSHQNRTPKRKQSVLRRIVTKITPRKHRSSVIGVPV